MSRRSQLRIYTIEPTTADEWVGLFYEHIVPLRAQHGFSVDWSYLSDDGGRFVWMASHDCPDGWEAAESTYYASPERSRCRSRRATTSRGTTSRWCGRSGPDVASEGRGPDHDGQPAGRGARCRRRA